MDPSQGETQGKSITSKLKAKVKGVKGKVHLPGHKKRHGDDNQANESDSSGYSSDDSPTPGPETGYNVGASTPFTTVKTTPLSPARESTTSHESHTRDYDSRPSHTTSGYDALHPSSAPMVSESPSAMAPTLDEKFQSRDVDTASATEGCTPKMGYAGDSLASPVSPTKHREGVLGSIKDTVGGAAAAVGSKMGYYSEVDQTPVVPTPRDPNAPSVIDKAKHTLGLDKPKDPFAPTLIEKTKATLGLGPSSPNTVTSPVAGTQPGVVDRVTGAMSSLFTGAPKTHTGEAVQNMFPAQSDYVPPAASVPHQSYTRKRPHGLHD